MRIFLSHSSRDKEFVRRLAQDLEHEGISSWIDEVELRVGDDLSAIEPAIREAGCIVVVLSVAASDSGWVEREVELARSMGEVRVLPVRLEEVQGHWAGGLAENSIADFRRPSEYRRALYRLVSAIKGVPNPELLTARQAARKVKAEMNPSGELFGLSQQGVATLYSLARPRDWVFADATNGTSRLWITEFYDHRKACVQAYAVKDGRIHELPALFLLDSDPQPVSASVIVYSCALNDELPDLYNEARPDLGRAGVGLRHVVKRYTCFRPLPIRVGEFIDSTEAISRAVELARERGMFRGRGEDLFTLAKLEHDKRSGGCLLWKVSFFDSTLVESVFAVGVDAVTKEVKHPAMGSELLNAAFFHTRAKDQKIVADVGHQLRAMESHVWDIPLPGELTRAGLTAGEAIELADRLLDADPSRRWQLAFLSNTGVVESVTSSHLSGPEEGLMKADGTAGQWVVEVYSGEPHVVSRGGRKGYAYDYRQILVTRQEGPFAVGPVTTWTFRVPLSRCPLPHRFLEAYERARVLAVRFAGADFRVMSVALNRLEGEAEWCFRFYDSENLLLVLRVSGDGMRVIA